VRVKEVTQGHKVEGEGVSGVRVTVSQPSPLQRFLSNKKNSLQKYNDNRSIKILKKNSRDSMFCR